MMAAGILLIANSGVLQGQQDELANRINNAYYNVKRAGLNELRCRISPNWKLTAGSISADVAGEEILNLLEHTRFDVAVGPDGSSTISRQIDTVPSSEQVAARFRTTLTGFEQVLTSFFQLWSQFTFHPIVPIGDKESVLEQLKGEYRIRQKSGQIEASMSINSGLKITEDKIVTQGKELIIRLDFGQYSGLYLFKGYEMAIPVGANSIHTIGTVEYQEVQGFELPSTVRMMVGTTMFAFDIGSYEIKKRN